MAIKKKSSSEKLFPTHAPDAVSTEEPGNAPPAVESSSAEPTRTSGTAVKKAGRVAIPQAQPPERASTAEDTRNTGQDSGITQARPKGRKPAVFLLDAMSFIFRAYHAMARQKGMSTRTGVPTAATYVFVNMLRKLQADFRPQYLAAVFDVAAPTFRDQQAGQITSIRKFDIKTQTFQEIAYNGYKANRTEMPGDLAQQLPYIRRALEAYRIPILEARGYEADDVIGTLSLQAAQEGHPVYVVSSDKDMLQLVGEHICVLNPPKDNLVCDRAKVEEILGVPPERVVDVMALRGDHIDNIPGAPGIGDKGSVELIKRFGSVEATLDHAHEVEKKTYRESLLNNRDVVLKSKELATIDTHVPVVLDLGAMLVNEPDVEAARQLFTELEFTSLIKEFLPSVAVSATDYRETAAGSDVEAVIRAMEKDGVLAIAFGSGLHRVTDTAEALDDEDVASDEGQFTLSPAQPGLATAAVPATPDTRLERVAVSAQAGAALTTKLDSEAGERLRAALSDPAIPKAVHDLKSALHALSADGRDIELNGVRDEPMLFSYLLDPTYSSHTLAEIALRRFNLNLSGSSSEQDKRSAAAVPSLAEAADFTCRMATALRKEVEQAGLMSVYDEIDLPLVPVLARMEQAGVKIDCDVLTRMSQRLEQECDLKAREVYTNAGEEFNINSPKQLGQVLFEKLALPKPVKYGKGRTVSTAVDVLESLATQHEVPRLVLEYRQLSKLKSTYVDALPALLNQCTQRLHTTFDQTNTATGRLSSKNPNLQNIPIRTELGREIRAAFIAEPGHVLLSADYSQVELRLLAHFSGDRLLLEAFQRGDDIHTLTASQVFGVPPLMVTAEHRRRAKAINFGIPYGLSPFGLAQQLGIEKSEAKQFIDAYFERYQGVRAWLDATMEQARREQKVSTLFSRIRPIPDINSRNANLRGFAERTAVNTPLQGTAADLIKLAMIRLDEEIRTRGLKSKMTLQVHDELVFEVPDAELETMRSLVRDRMENVHKLRVPLLVELGVGKNWRDLE